MIELLPCPFCGSKNLVKSNKLFGSVIICNDCECRGPGIFKSYEYSLENTCVAERKWNIRALLNQKGNVQ